MHEYSIVQALLDRVEEEARSQGASRVHAVRVRIGELAGVEVELLRTAYETIRRGTACENAPLEVTISRAKWTCPKCRTIFAHGAALQCEACGTPAKLASGDEIMLDQLELEVANV